MDNIKESLEYAVQLSEEKAKIFELKEGTFSTKSLHRLLEREELLADSIKVSTMTSIVDFIRSNVDNLDLSQHFIDIQTPTCLALKSALNKDKNRSQPLTSVSFTPNIKFGYYYSSEEFNILMQSAFERNEDRDIILQVVGNLRETAVKTVGDDGVSQSVVISTGIANVENVKVPNPVMLAPFRTFLEIEQPRSKFVFRMKEGGECALFEADGGMWQIEAKQSIKHYLEKNLEDIVPAIMIMA